MKLSSIAKLAAGFAAGTITAEFIKDQYGDDVMDQILGLTGGVVAGSIVSSFIDESGVSDFLDDIF